MAWYSILPPQLIQFESWAVRIFLLLGLITIVPWAALIIFDAGLYLYRMILWELPWIGGRARGHQRPRAPSLNERPDGQRRGFSFPGIELDSRDGLRARSRATSTDHEPENGDQMRQVHEQGKENIAPIASNGRALSSAEEGLKRRTTGRA